MKFFKTKYKFPCLLITILLFSASWFYCCLPLDLGKVLSFLWDLYMAAVYWANKTEWSNKTKQNRLSLLPDGTYFVQRNSGMKPIACIHVFTTILHLKKTNLATLSGPSFKPCSSLSSESYPCHLKVTHITYLTLLFAFLFQREKIIIMIIIKTTTTKNNLKESLRKSCLPKCDEFRITGTAKNLNVMNSLPKHYIVKDI